MTVTGALIATAFAATVFAVANVLEWRRWRKRRRSAAREDT